MRFRGAKPLRGVAPLLAVLALCGCAPSRTIVTGPEADLAERNIRLPEAEQLLQRALEIRPDDGYFLDSLAWVHFRRGDYRRAEADLLQALKFVPDDPVILEHLGDVLQAQGRNEEAAALFEKAIAKGHEKPDEVGVKIHRLRKAQPAGK